MAKEVSGTLPSCKRKLGIHFQYYTRDAHEYCVPQLNVIVHRSLGTHTLTHAGLEFRCSSHCPGMCVTTQAVHSLRSLPYATPFPRLSWLHLQPRLSELAIKLCSYFTENFTLRSLLWTNSRERLKTTLSIP